MKTGFIGVGSMGGMLVRSLLRAGALPQEDVYVANRSRAKLDALAVLFPGIQIVSNSQLAANCDWIFVCVSLNNLSPLLDEIGSDLTARCLLITTSAPIPLRALEERVPCRVAKLIPSVTQEIGAGIALLMYGSRITSDDRRQLLGFLSFISEPVEIPESLARPAIGLTSGGPALIAYLLRSMAEGAVRSNAEMPAELADRLVQGTATATMRLFIEASMTPDEVRERVAAPGGMTALALEVLSRYLPGAWQLAFEEVARREIESWKSLGF